MPGADFRGTAGEEGNGIVYADGFAGRQINAAIEALTPISDPSTADAEDVAIKVNEIITALKSE